MNTNKITICITIIIIILIITVPTIYKIIQNHQDNLYLVIEEKIILAASKCYYDEVCTEEKITLNELYENGYLDKVSNPVTKEYYNENSYVERNGTKFIFVEIKN